MAENVLRKGNVTRPAIAHGDPLPIGAAPQSLAEGLASGAAIFPDGRFVFVGGSGRTSSVTYAEALARADLILAVEDPVPFIPAFHKRWPSGQVPPIVQIGVDPLFGDLPLRGFPVDLALPGDPAESLRLLTRLLDADPPAGAEARREALAREHLRIFADAFEAADVDGARVGISKRWLSRCTETSASEESKSAPSCLARKIP